MRRRASTLWIAVALLLAGCAGTAPHGEEDPPRPAPGRIEGRVLDESMLPVPDALVRVLLTTLQTRTDAHGDYGLEEVPSGPLIVVATAADHATQTQRGTLEPEQTLRMDFELRAAPSLRPYHDPEVFEGSVPCGFPGSLGCGPAGEGELPRIRFEVEPGLRGVLLELEWSAPVAGVAQRLQVNLKASTPTACGELIDSAEGPSLLRLEALEGFPIAGGHLCAIIYPGGQDLVVDQPYRLHVTRFYHAPPPPGFSAVPP